MFVVRYHCARCGGDFGYHTDDAGFENNMQNADRQYAEHSELTHDCPDGTEHRVDILPRPKAN